MNSISFSQFAEAVRCLFPGDLNNGEYVKELFSKIVDFGENEEGNPIYSRSTDTFKRYYSGNSIRGFAGLIIGNLDLFKFENYVGKQSPDDIEAARKSLAEYLPESQYAKFPQAVAQLFEGIIRSESKGKEYIPEKTIQYTLPMQTEYIPTPEIDILREESSGKCLICGKRLKNQTVLDIVPKTSNVEERNEICKALQTRGVEDLPDLNGSFSTSSIENHALVDANCKTDYEAHFKPDKAAQLLIAKHKASQRMLLMDMIDSLEIDEYLGKLLDSMDCLINSEDIESLKYAPHDIKEKIEPEHVTLKLDVSSKVSMYYGFIEEQLHQRDGVGGFDFEDLAMSVRRCYKNLAKQGLNKECIYTQMSLWVQRMTGCENIVACQIFIAFFVQECEVFDEIA